MATVIPVFRAFSYDLTIAFYIDWLGATILWEHRPEHTPFYMQVSLKETKINLSQHHGDCSPGGLVILDNCTALKTYHQQLLDKDYTFMKPGLEKADWDPHSLMMTVIDPAYNRIIFTERV
ncbi:MAG: glyoxalase superfamily protein [Pedobacter sp.]|nr:glyoxalase superfamily protein [Pedobacter sp.]MDQ8054500.1 glyoxalase superfamily protein [Pedobacter sp.]